jgi:hypothetical protein
METFVHDVSVNVQNHQNSSIHVCTCVIYIYITGDFSGRRYRVGDEKIILRDPGVFLDPTKFGCPATVVVPVPTHV